MIVKGNQRGGGLQLAKHLLNDKDNDHVRVQELRGFVAGTLSRALQETVAIAKGTKCRQFLFSVSLNPPHDQTVDTAAFVKAADQVERKLGLEGQPRALVIHEKDGRRHAHAVWSRIDIDTMTAINLPHYKLKLQDVSKALFREHGWPLPKGLAEKAQQNPFNFSREEWQQARRGGQDPKAIKALFKECWQSADTADALKTALAAKGFLLAKGDRRAVVAVDYRGEVYALSRWAGVKAKDVKARFGDEPDLPSLIDAKAIIADQMTEKIERYVADVQKSLKRGNATLALKRAQLKDRHVAERAALHEAQAKRWVEETKDRASRFRSGMRGLWDRMTGKHATIQKQNEQEAYDAIARDDAEQDQLTRRQLIERRKLQSAVAAMRQRHHRDLEKLRADVADYAGWSGTPARDRPETARLDKGELDSLKRRTTRDAETDLDDDRTPTP